MHEVIQSMLDDENVMDRFGLQDRNTQIHTVVCRRRNLKEISECRVLAEGGGARQHRMMVFRATLGVENMKRTKAEQRMKWFSGRS